MSDFTKALSVIRSCETIKQMRTAFKYVEVFRVEAFRKAKLGRTRGVWQRFCTAVDLCRMLEDEYHAHYSIALANSTEEDFE
jgi:hypothetical protein